MDPQTERRGWSWWYLLFIVQFVAVLWPPFYNQAEPSWIGIPFFYWYQMLWVLVGAVLTAIVYFATETSSSAAPIRRDLNQRRKRMTGDMPWRT